VIPLGQNDEGMKYRFSRPARRWVVTIAFVMAIAGTVMFFAVGDWDAVAAFLVGVFGIGGLLARQLGIGTWLTDKFPHAPLPRLLTSVAILGIVAVASRNPELIMAVAGVLFAWNVVQFWWDKRRSEKTRPTR
jgi:hypothetical protein